MGSLIEELQRREAAARREADELRGEIAQLNERLAQAEERLSRLEITRETVAEILGGAGADQPVAGEAVEAVVAAGPAPGRSRRAGGCAVGVAVLLPGPSGGLGRCRAAVAGWPDRCRGRVEHRQVQDRGAACETEAAGGAWLAGRGRAGVVYGAAPRCAGCVKPARLRALLPRFEGANQPGPERRARWQPTTRPLRLTPLPARESVSRPWWRIWPVAGPVR